MECNSNLKRCDWCGSDPLDIKYHDEEWGRYTNDDKILFEFLILESAQAGLSWKTILQKREGYRKAFYGFDVQKTAQMSEADIERLMNDKGIVRNRLKIKSAKSNAQAFIAIQNEFGSFAQYLHSFLPKGKSVILNKWQTISEAPASTPLSDNITKDMKKRGFKFFGTTICYAFLQATGYVNDHLTSCHCYPKDTK